MPTMAPVRKPIVMAGSRPWSWRPRRPAGWRARRGSCRGSRPRPEKPAPTRKKTERKIRTVDVVGGQRQQREERDRREDRRACGTAAAGRRWRPPGPPGRCSSCCRCLRRRQGPRWRNIAAIASAPSAIRATTMTRTRLPPERSTTAGMIPVMRFLLGVMSRLMNARGVYAGASGIVSRHTRCDAVPRAGTVEASASAAAQRAASAASAESWITNTLARPVIRKILSSRSWLQTSSQRAVVGADLLQAADQHAEAGGVEELDVLACRSTMS